MKPKISTVAKADESTSPAQGRRESQIGRILAAAQNCFAQSGFRGASMQEICSKADMSPGALYRYFPSKEAIVGAIAETERNNNSLAALAEHGPVVDQIVDGAMIFLTRVTEHNTSALMAEILSESLRNESIAEVRKNAQKPVFDKLNCKVLAAAERGEIDPVISLHQVVPAFLAVVESFAINEQWRKTLKAGELRTVLHAVLSSILRPKDNPGAAR